MVTNTLDDGSPGSLRSAIDLANADPDLTTITFASGVTGTITLTTGPLVVYSALDIVGPGAGVLRVDAGGQSSVFVFYGDAYDGSSTISDITISGAAPVSFQVPSESGGGIFGDDAHLTVDSVVVEQNTAFLGGGVLLVGGDVQFVASDSIIRDNLVDDDVVLGGGGIALVAFPSSGPPGPAPTESSVTLIDSTVSGNTTSGAGGVVVTTIGRRRRRKGLRTT